MEARTEVFYFGPEARLLGFHSAPAQNPGRGSVLICPSLFSDTTRSQWVTRNLAARLAEAGSHAFRFDFSGMAGSAGGAPDRTVRQWTNDLGAAVDEAETRCGRRLDAVFAVRAGMLMWANAAGLPRVDRFVAWDPFPTGASFFAAMRHLQDIYEERTPSPDPAYALGGLTVDAAVAAELETLGMPAVEAERRYHLCSADAPPAELPGRWQAVCVDSAYDWTTWELHVFHAHDVIRRALEVLG